MLPCLSKIHILWVPLWFVKNFSCCFASLGLRHLLFHSIFTMLFLLLKWRASLESFIILIGTDIDCISIHWSSYHQIPTYHSPTMNSVWITNLHQQKAWQHQLDPRPWYQVIPSFVELEVQEMVQWAPWDYVEEVYQSWCCKRA